MTNVHFFERRVAFRFLFILSFGLLECLSMHVAVSQEAKFEPTPASPNFKSITYEEIESAVRNLHPAPRLLLTDEKMEEVRAKVESTPCWKNYYVALKKLADDKAREKPIEREVVGIRLLDASQEALARIFSWSFLYRYAKDVRYAKRVEQEALAIAAFSDWHPSHFLDVAEMTTAMAIGYDSCKDAFDEDSRTIVRDAIYDKGLGEVIKGKSNVWFKRNTANWNQVCWCGALYGALAILDDLDDARRVDAKLMIQSSINGVTWSMASYEPDGNYTEGASYWGYGTSFNILLLAALKSSLGTDFGRSDSPGFLKTIEYYENLFGPTGDAFNYSDSGKGHMEPATFWYVAKFDRPEVAWNEVNAVLAAQGKVSGDDHLDACSFDSMARSRLAPLALLWGEIPSQLTPPSKLGYAGRGDGRCRVALFRTAWDRNAAWLGVKCGTPKAPHGHMDEGSFVYDDSGVRWIVELGSEDYHSVESRGMDLWGMGADSDRWKLLRYNNFGHSVPTINGKLQIADAMTVFTDVKLGGSSEDSYAVVDLAPVYRTELACAIRKATLLRDGSVVIEDAFEALPDKEAAIERRFITPAVANVLEDGFLLTIPKPSIKGRTEGKFVKTFKTTTDTDKIIERSVFPCETQEEYDSKNPRILVISEKVKLAPGEKIVLTSRFSTTSVE